jgi:hypothetical protein
MKSFEILYQEHLAFTTSTFTETTPMSSLEKCEDEIKEVKQLLNGDNVFPPHELTEEYVDCVMCLLDSMARAGIDLDTFRAAFSRKVKINNVRSWKKNENNYYSHK